MTASRSDLLDHTAGAAEWREMVISGLAPAAVFLASIPLAYFVSPAIARLSWASLLILNPAVGVLMTRGRRPKNES